jgi:hypothetical protein
VALGLGPVNEAPAKLGIDSHVDVAVRIAAIRDLRRLDAREIASNSSSDTRKQKW